LVEVLELLPTGVGVEAVIAFLFEQFEWFKKLAPKARRWVVLGISWKSSFSDTILPRLAAIRLDVTALIGNDQSSSLKSSTSKYTNVNVALVLK
jgi:hypothetical protein